MTGCDISYAQGTVNFDQLKKSVDFVIIRAGYTGAPDTQFKRNQAEARRVGLRRGYYWFTYPSNPTTDADQFVNTVGALQPGEFMCLDYEVPQGGVAYCKAFLDRVKSRTGTLPFLYTNENRTITLDWSSCKTYPLWVAIYDNSPTAPVNTGGWPYVIKQYTADGRVGGVAGAVDLDYATSDPTKYGKGGQMADITKAQEQVLSIAVTGSKPGSAYDYRNTKSNVQTSDIDALVNFWNSQSQVPKLKTQVSTLQTALDDANKKLQSAGQTTVQLDPQTKAQIDQTNQNTNWLVATFKKIFNIGS